MRYILAIILTAVVAMGCTDETKVQRVTLSPTSMELQIGESFQIEMIVSPLSAAIHNPTAWQSSDPNVAQVDDDGNVTAIYAGECVITGQASHVEAKCSVRVTTPTYTLQMDKATVYNNGVSGGNTTNNLIIRLHDSDLTMDSMGGTTGNGVFLNISAFAPIAVQTIPAGHYTTATLSGSEYSIEPGRLITENGNNYATGSFLGRYTDNGLSVLFINSGEMEVNDDGTYAITCAMDGEKNEHIDAKYSGTPTYYNTSTESETEVLHYTDVKCVSATVEGETETGHRTITFETEEATTVRLTARVPLSSKSIPPGQYSTDTASRPFTLTHTLQTEYEAIITGTDTAIVSSATLIVQTGAAEGEMIYRATLTDKNNNQYIIYKAGNMSYINKLALQR